MDCNEKNEGKNQKRERQDVRDWERSEWFRQWMELIRPKRPQA